jgi:hypothetical protein
VGLDPPLPERPLELGRHGLVLDRHEAGQQFDNRHVTAEGSEDRSELDAYRAGAEDHDRLRHLLERDRLVARDDASSIDLHAGYGPWLRARGDHDLLLRAKRLRLLAGHLDVAVAEEARRPLDPVDLVLAEEELDALGEGGDHLVLPRLDLLHVDPGARAVDRQPPLLRALRDFQRVGVLEQRLCRNAAPDEARAAQRLLLLDDRDAQAQLGGADGRRVTTGAGADHHQVVFSRHSSSSVIAISVRSDYRYRTASPASTAPGCGWR